MCNGNNQSRSPLLTRQCLYFFRRPSCLVGGVDDVSPLAHCVKLHTLDVSRCEALTDISTLAHCISLHTLDISRCDNITDVSALAQCTNLRNINVNWSGVTDISSLQSCFKLCIIGFNKPRKLNLIPRKTARYTL